MMAGEPQRTNFRSTEVDITAKRASHARSSVLQMRHITAFREPERSRVGGRSLSMGGAASERCHGGSVKATVALHVTVM